MIIWINGPYGVGKSTLARELHKNIENSFIFDAEKVGDAVRENFPEEFFKETYEEFPLWCETCANLLLELSRCYSGTVFVPMTLLRRSSYDSIISKLRAKGAEVVHVMLEADAASIRERILSRGEDEDCWCMNQIKKCLSTQSNLPADLRLPTVGVPVPELAKSITSAFSSP